MSKFLCNFFRFFQKFYFASLTVFLVSFFVFWFSWNFRFPFKIFILVSFQNFWFPLNIPSLFSLQKFCLPSKIFVFLMKSIFYKIFILLFFQNFVLTSWLLSKNLRFLLNFCFSSKYFVFLLHFLFCCLSKIFILFLSKTLPLFLVEAFIFVSFLNFYFDFLLN